MDNKKQNFVLKETTINFDGDLKMSREFREYNNESKFTILPREVFKLLTRTNKIKSVIPKITDDEGFLIQKEKKEIIENKEFLKPSELIFYIKLIQKRKFIKKINYRGLSIFLTNDKNKKLEINYNKITRQTCSKYCEKLEELKLITIEKLDNYYKFIKIGG